MDSHSRDTLSSRRAHQASSSNKSKSKPSPLDYEPRSESTAAKSAPSLYTSKDPSSHIPSSHKTSSSIFTTPNGDHLGFYSSPHDLLVNQDYHLQAVGSQLWTDQPYQTTTIAQQPQDVPASLLHQEPKPHCPYHDPIFALQPTSGARDQGLQPMSRYLAEGPAEQYALVRHPDTEGCILGKGCCCFVPVASRYDGVGYNGTTVNNQ